MPIKLSVGLAKKVGQPDYGSLGASCHVELELDGSLLRDDLEGFHHHVRNAFTACRQAVTDELNRNSVKESPQGTNGTSRIPSENGNQSPRRNGSGPHRASQKQTDYIGQLSRQIPGLGGRQLKTVIARMHDKPLAELTSIEASAVIDALRAVKEGRIQLDAVLNEAPV